MYPKTYIEIIYEICSKYNICVESISDTTVLKLTLNNIIHYIWSRRFDINTSVSARLADNKFETYRVLETNNIPVVKCAKITRLFTEEYKDSGETNFSICNNMLLKYGSIVIKPNSSYEGYDVYKCTSTKRIEEILNILYNKYKYIVISPFINIKSEYRAIYFNGEILLIYEKQLPYVISDGKTSLIELLIKKDYCSYIKMFSDDELCKVYHKGKRINLNWKFNLSQGSYCSIIDEQQSLYNKLNSLAISAANAINITFASVDIVIDTDGKLRILEINSGVAMDQFIMKVNGGRKIATSIYEKVIKHMFYL